MSYINDQIKLLELICVDMPPAEFNDKEEVVTLLEEDLQREGFSYNEVLILLKGMYEIIKDSSILTSQDGKRKINILVNSNVQFYLHSLKYPDEAMNEISEEFAISNPSFFVSKILINIDNKKGIYKNNDFTKSYKLKFGSNREKIILFLCKKDRVKILELQKETKQSLTLIIKEIKAINKLFREKLSVVDDLIIYIPTGGCSLNKDVFDIRLQQ